MDVLDERQGGGFDIVRVEPTGEAVVAGLAGPGDTVELMDAGAAIAKAVANDRGEWAMSLDSPLKPGTHDLAIRTTSGDKKSVAISDQRVAVSIAESKKENPLVVLSTPDGPSKVIEMPKAPPAAVAAAEPPAAGAGDGVEAGLQRSRRRGGRGRLGPLRLRGGVNGPAQRAQPPSMTWIWPVV